MLRFHLICDQPTRLHALTGLPVHQFMLLAHIFDRMFVHRMRTETLDGYRREERAYSPYANSPLPTSEDKLLFILTYMKQNTTQEVLGQLFGMTQSNVSKWYRIILPVLRQAMGAQNMLPARTCEELLHILMEGDETLDTADTQPQSSDDMTHVDVSAPFFITMAQNVP